MFKIIYLTKVERCDIIIKLSDESGNRSIAKIFEKKF